MARFKIGDSVKVNLTKGSIYDKKGTITSYGNCQYDVIGQIYSVPYWKVQLEDGETITISEKHLNPCKERR